MSERSGYSRASSKDLQRPRNKYHEKRIKTGILLTLDPCLLCHHIALAVKSNLFGASRKVDSIFRLTPGPFMPYNLLAVSDAEQSAPRF